MRRVRPAWGRRMLLDGLWIVLTLLALLGTVHFVDRMNLADRWMGP
jgi:hypothetical protein